MEIKFDTEVNAAYLALADRSGESVESVPVVNRAGEVFLVVDMASDGRILGVEFLDAARQLPGYAEE